MVNMWIIILQSTRDYGRIMRSMVMEKNILRMGLFIVVISIEEWEKEKECTCLVMDQSMALLIKKLDIKDNSIVIKWMVMEWCFGEMVVSTKVNSKIMILMDTEYILIQMEVNIRDM